LEIFYKWEVKIPLLLPSSSLSRQIPTSGIVAAIIKKYEHMMEAKKHAMKDGILHKRGPYEHFSSQEKAQFGKYTAEHDDHRSPTSIQIHHTYVAQ